LTLKVARIIIYVTNANIDTQFHTKISLLQIIILSILVIILSINHSVG